MKRRLISGLVLGVFVGMLGPALDAVANHTGNRSGSEPLDASSVVTLAQRGDARWGGQVIFFTFSVTRRIEALTAANPSTSRLDRSDAGEAVATRNFCDAGVCTTKTWRGPLGSPYTEGASFIQDPTLHAAHFRGWLRVDGTGTACLFTVDWTGDGPGSSGSSNEVHRGEHDASVSGSASASTADAAATATAPCWDAHDPIALGEGKATLSLEVSGDAAAAETLGSFHAPPPLCQYPVC